MEQDDHFPLGMALLGVVDLGSGAQDGPGKAKLRTGVLHNSPRSGRHRMPILRP
jgi:hypothetical protein